MAASRKRGAAAFAVSDSRSHQEPVAKRERLVTGSAGAKVREPFSDADENMSALPTTSDHQEVDGSRHQDANVQSDRPLFLLDLFCGTAGVAAAFKACGGDALGIDHIIDKRRVKGPVSKVDLTQQSGQDTILGWLRDGRVDAVMLAPPCGTASRAREIPIPHGKGLKRQPMPLRSDKFPMGIPSLKGVARQKAKAANRLCKFARKVIDVCVGRHPSDLREPTQVLDVADRIFSRPSCPMSFSAHTFMHVWRQAQKENFLFDEFQGVKLAPGMRWTTPTLTVGNGANPWCPIRTQVFHQFRD